MRAVLLYLLVIGVTSAASSTKDTITRNQLDEAIMKLRAGPRYVPAFIANLFVQHFTPQEGRELLNFVNKFAKGEIRVTKADQLPRSLQQNAPTIAPRFAKVFGKYSEKLRKISPTARAYTTKWVNEFIHLFNNRANKPLLMQKVKQFFTETSKLSSKDIASFAREFPRIYNFLTTAPDVIELRKFTEKLPDNKTAYNDPKNIAKFMKLLKRAIQL